jgi:glycine/D-amino acid oxidase-like deaminating enzyme
MTSSDPETSALRKTRVLAGTLGDRDYWRTHVPMTDPEDDPVCDEAAEGLDAWIAAGCKHD